MNGGCVSTNEIYLYDKLQKVKFADRFGFTPSEVDDMDSDDYEFFLTYLEVEHHIESTKQTLNMHSMKNKKQMNQMCR